MVGDITSMTTLLTDYLGVTKAMFGLSHLLPADVISTHRELKSYTLDFLMQAEILSGVTACCQASIKTL